MSLGVHLDQIRDIRIVHGVAVNQTELRCKDTYSCFLSDPKEMLGVRVICGDAFAVEIIVEVLNLLVTGKEHEIV